MAKPTNIASIEHATNKSWDEWVAFLDQKGARDLDHRQIADLVFESLKIESAGWWSQGVTVAYEQHIGRRAAGQRSDGTYETSATKTIEGDRKDVFGVLVKALEKLTNIGSQKIINPRTSITPVRSYWRCELENEDKVTVAVENRTPDKSLVSVVQSNMKSQKDSEKAKTYWKDFLDNVL